MPTRKELKEAWKSWTPIKLTVHDFCDVCNKGKYWDALIVKLPEAFTFCIECAEKNKDEKSYKRSVYQIGIWFIDKNPCNT